MSFEYLSDKRAYFVFAGLAIPDVSGIHPAVVKLLFSGWFVGSSDGRESRQWSGVPTSRALTDLESSLWWSYRTCLVWTTRGQWLIFKYREGREFRHKSGVPTVGSSGMCREFRHLIFFNSVTWFSNLLRIGSSDMSREFRWSGVPAFIGSSDASQLHCNLVTVGAV